MNILSLSPHQHLHRCVCSTCHLRTIKFPEDCPREAFRGGGDFVWQHINVNTTWIFISVFCRGQPQLASFIIVFVIIGRFHVWL